MKAIEAEALWDSLRDAFQNAEQAIVQIIEARAWEPLGYDTFAQAWAARMKGVRLATDAVRAHVAYAMFADGMTPMQMQEAVGFTIGDTAAERLREQRDRGVPPSLATTRVRAHDRLAPSAPDTLHVRLTPAELASLKEIARARGLDVTDEAAKAIRAHFRKLERARRAA